MPSDDKETLNRRARLRELIEACFSDRDTDLLAHIELRTGKRPNQGELSAIQRDNSGKSFADRKAKSLTEQIGLHRRWFDMPPGTNLHRSQWLAEQSSSPGDLVANSRVENYPTKDPAIIEVIEIMKSVNRDYQQQILGNAKMLMAEFRIKHPNKRQRAHQ